MDSSILALANVSDLDANVVDDDEPNSIFLNNSSTIGNQNPNEIVEESNSENNLPGESDLCLTNTSFSNLSEKNMDGDSIKDEKIEIMDNLRSFGITLCSNLLHYMPLSSEAIIQRILRSLTSHTTVIDSDVFSEIETQVIF